MVLPDQAHRTWVPQPVVRSLLCPNVSQIHAAPPPGRRLSGQDVWVQALATLLQRRRAEPDPGPLDRGAMTVAKTSGSAPSILSATSFETTREPRSTASWGRWVAEISITNMSGDEGGVTEGGSGGCWGSKRKRRLPFALIVSPQGHGNGGGWGGKGSVRRCRGFLSGLKC